VRIETNDVIVVTEYGVSNVQLLRYEFLANVELGKNIFDVALSEMSLHLRFC